MRIRVNPSVYWTGQVIDYSSGTAYNKTIPLLVDSFEVSIPINDVFRQYDRVKRLVSQKRWVEVAQITGGVILKDFRGVGVVGLGEQSLSLKEISRLTLCLTKTNWNI